MPDPSDPGANVYTIAPEHSFVDVLAQGLMARHARPDDPMALAEIRIFVPTRRAVRSLSEAFLRAAGTRGTGTVLLPAIVPLGDVEEDALELERDAAVAPGAVAEAGGVPPAIPDPQRTFTLSHLILRWAERERAAGRQTAATDLVGALAQAEDLGQFLDSFDTYGLDPDALDSVVPDEFTDYWRETLSFLRIVTRTWPQIREEMGGLDAIARRNLMLRTLARHWRDHPPATPVIAAGSTGSIPATAELLSVIARLPQGCVVLPGLDLDLSEADWQAVDDTHPQAGMKELLAHLNVPRRAVLPWPGAVTAPPRHPALTARRRLIGEALRPAAVSEGWRQAVERFEAENWGDGLKGLSAITAAHPGEEALVIALILREVLERPEASAALVTPDRALARRVVALMRRWNIAIDDSAGTPLGQTRAGTFLRLVAACAGDIDSPAPLLTLLKHPLTGCGLSRDALRRAVSLFEQAVLRGPRPSGGPNAWRAVFQNWKRTQKERGNAVPDDGVTSLLNELEAALVPFSEKLRGEALALPDLVRAHIQCAERLSAGTGGRTNPPLWAGDDGEAAANFLRDLLDHGAAAPPLAGAHYPALFDHLIGARVLRPRYGLHPRLHIWGPLEARLQRADVLVLGSLNEGTWPAPAEPDPWLSRPMRAQLGLPAPERRIGLAAHDFAQLTSAPRVVLTRSARVDGAPTVPSRWLLRLETILRGAGALDRLAPETPYLAWARQMDQPRHYAPLAPPEPRPPVAARPRRLSVTEIETWVRDPYAIYAKHVLGLRPLDPLDDDPGRAERGVLIHAILEEFVRTHPRDLPPDAVQRLIDLGRKAFAETRQQPAVKAVWWPRFLRLAAWFIAHERAWRRKARPIKTEARGETVLCKEESPFFLRARADRIDVVNGGMALIDYKTGGVPSASQVKSFFSPQLPLEGLIAQDGGFEDVPAGPVECFCYLQLKGGPTAGREETIATGEAARDLIEQAKQGLVRLIRSFDRPETPYLSAVRPMRLADARPYDHLARLKEWRAPGADAKNQAPPLVRKDPP